MANSYTSIGKVTLNRKLGKLLDELKADMAKKPSIAGAIQEIISGLERMKNGKEEPRIKPLALYLDMLEILREETLFTNTFPSLVYNAEVIYNNLFFFGEQTPDFDNKAEIFKHLAGRSGLVVKGFFDPYLFASFADKMQYLTLVQVIAEQNYALSVFSALRSHALEVRQFLVDDEAYLAYLLRTARMLAETAPDSYEAVLKEELWKMQRCNGLYDIDPVRLAKVESNVQRAALAVEGGKNVLDALERKNHDMEKIAQEVETRANDTLRNADTMLDSKVKEAGKKLDDVLNEYAESQKKAIYLEREIFLKEMFSEAETEMSKYKAMAKALTATTAAEVASLGKDADAVIDRLKNAASTNGKLMEATKRVQQDQDLLDKLDKLSLINDVMIQKMGLQVEKAAEQSAAPAPRPAGEEASPSRDARNSLNAGTGSPMPGPEAEAMPFYRTRDRREERPIPPVNPMMDRNVPFKKRFQIAMKEKQRRMQQGELFHEMFDDVLTAVMEEVNPYLIGPSGCGKTYMIRQIGEILNVELFDIGYINEEYDILGYVTAMGEYSESNFYRLYKYGGIAFCDELDNGNSKATVKLNSFLSNNQKAGYCFPGGEYVEKHPNFRVIAAGNTDGSGADMNYSTREKIEESVQQRMIPIYVSYDNRVEQEILRDYPDWFEFACAFRAGTDHWEAVCGIPAAGIFTTRDAYRVKMYLDNGSFTPEKIMNYEFVQTKEPEYLGFLKDDIGKRLKKGSGAYAIYQLFVTVADAARKKRKGV